MAFYLKKNKEVLAFNCLKARTM